jgi:hypothetical protein
MSLPACGSVVGIDVGCSEKRRSSSVCRLDWDDSAIQWSMKRFKATDSERSSVISALAGRRLLLGASVDGPLRVSLDLIGRYRVAERMLTRRLQKLIGKPGQSNAPIGRKLNANANACVNALLGCAILQPATHGVAIHPLSVSEAFPSSFLGVMIDNPALLAARRRDRSDKFFNYLASAGTLDRLVNLFVSGRRLNSPFVTVKNHDDRAALVCALTALCVAGGDFTAVGDEDGWIILPPMSFIHTWARTALEANNSEERTRAFYASGNPSATAATGA